MGDDSRGRILRSLVRASLSRRRPPGANSLLVELSSSLESTEDVAQAFREACVKSGQMGGSALALAARMTASSILNSSCRSVGLPEPHIDAAATELMAEEEEVAEN